MAATSEPSARVRLAVDIGGTFTDVVLERAGSELVTTKLLTTAAHPAEAVLAGIDRILQRAALVPADVGSIIHGRILAIHALIERRKEYKPGSGGGRREPSAVDQDPLNGILTTPPPEEV